MRLVHALSAAAALAAAALLMGTGGIDPPGSGKSTASVAVSSPAPVAAVAAAPERPRAAIAPRADDDPQRVLREGSLRDSVPDGRVTVDAAGNVVADLDLRRMFDYYLSTIGELDPVRIRVLFVAQLRGAQPERVVQQALALFDRYVDYQRALAGLDAGAIADPRARVDAVKALRRRTLGEDLAAAFFGDEERYDEIMARRLAVANDASLDRDEKRREIERIDAQLPPALRERRDDADSATLIAATPAGERASVWGADAAKRLAALDDERARWDSRVAEYRAKSAGLTDVARQSLLERSFSEPERRRVLALEEIAARGQ